MLSTTFALIRVVHITSVSHTIRMMPMLSDDCRKSLSQQAFKFHRTDGLSIYIHHDSFTVPLLIKMTALRTSVARCDNCQTSKMSICKLASAKRSNHLKRTSGTDRVHRGTGPRVPCAVRACALDALESTRGWGQQDVGQQDIGRMGIPGRVQAPAPRLAGGGGCGRWC